MERLTVSQQIDQFIAENGGNERDALNVALARLEQATRLLESGNVVVSQFVDWDVFAKAVESEFGSSLVDGQDDPDDPYNWWLVDVTVADIVDFVRNYQ